MKYVWERKTRKALRKLRKRTQVSIYRGTSCPYCHRPYRLGESHVACSQPQQRGLFT